MGEGLRQRVSPRGWGVTEPSTAFSRGGCGQSGLVLPELCCMSKRVRVGRSGNISCCVGRRMGRSRIHKDPGSRAENATFPCCHEPHPGGGAFQTALLEMSSTILWTLGGRGIFQLCSQGG